MSTQNEALDSILTELSPVILPPAEYPPAVIVRDTPREELMARIKSNAEKINMKLGDEHEEVISFLFDFYSHCCEAKDPGYIAQKTYWKYIDRTQAEDCKNPIDQADDHHCKYGQLTYREATKAYRIYRILLKAFKDKGGSKYLYTLFPHGVLFSIHLLAQLPRLSNGINAHTGTVY
jgi:sulfur relay (sulfurtransferase) DsrC/TusE family protein